MAYSAKKYWTLRGGALTLAAVGFALLVWLKHNHTDPVSLGLFRLILALIVVGLGMGGLSYTDEVQRQMGQKRWFWGSMIGIAAMLPLVVFLQTHQTSLDAAVQFIFHNTGLPTLYFSLGIMIPVIFQGVSTLLLRLRDKLSSSSQP